MKFVALIVIVKAKIAKLGYVMLNLVQKDIKYFIMALVKVKMVIRF